MCSDTFQWQVLAVRRERSLPLEARARRNVLQRDTLVKKSDAEGRQRGVGHGENSTVRRS
jgi:hypothetical protein